MLPHKSSTIRSLALVAAWCSNRAEGRKHSPFPVGSENHPTNKPGLARSLLVFTNLHDMKCETLEAHFHTVYNLLPVKATTHIKQCCHCASVRCHMAGLFPERRLTPLKVKRANFDSHYLHTRGWFGRYGGRLCISSPHLNRYDAGVHCGARKGLGRYISGPVSILNPKIEII